MVPKLTLQHLLTSLPAGRSGLGVLHHAAAEGKKLLAEGNYTTQQTNFEYKRTIPGLHHMPCGLSVKVTYLVKIWMHQHDIIGQSGSMKPCGVY